jgi:hypothetical protein
MNHWRERLFGALKGKRSLRVLGPLLGVVVLAALLATTVSASTTPTTYYACVNMKTGSIYMINAGDTCKAGYTPISWNQVGPQGPQGPAGPTGQTGLQGPAGPTQTPRMTTAIGEAITLSPPTIGSSVGVVVASCPLGTVVTGGGFFVDGSSTNSSWLILDSYPDTSPIFNTWIVNAQNTGPDNVTINAFAACLSLV